MKRKIIKTLIIILSLLLMGYFLINFFIKPSNNRDWSLDQELLAYAEINDNLVSVFNIRNFDYLSTTNYTPSYYNKEFDLEKIKRVWYVVEPFPGIPGSAHTFLSFEFEDEEFITISVEIRKERGEDYHPFKGLFNQYELIYVIADERDSIRLRSNYRKDLVYLYPAKAEPEKVAKLFLDMLNRANDLKNKPEFYNTITNTCTTNIVSHINEINPGRVPFFNLSILLPENSDKLAYNLGLIDTELSFEEAREKFLINERAMIYDQDPDFSIKIRENF